MKSRARFAGHPVHQMLVTFPIGAFGFAVASDALHSWLRERKYQSAATLALDFGLVSAALAAPFGLIDWWAIAPGTRAKRVGLWHALGNGALLALFGSSRWLRSKNEPAAAKWLSAVGLLSSGVTAWLGGELISRHGVGVNEPLGLNVPSSLSKSG